MHSLEPDHLAAGAGEDWAALSGRPRKADAGQYESVMPQRGSIQTCNATTPTESTVPPHAL
jgi:hypothetical protein